MIALFLALVSGPAWASPFVVIQAPVTGTAYQGPGGHIPVLVGARVFGATFPLPPEWACLINGLPATLNVNAANEVSCGLEISLDYLAPSWWTTPPYPAWPGPAPHYGLMLTDTRMLIHPITVELVDLSTASTTRTTLAVDKVTVFDLSGLPSVPDPVPLPNLTDDLFGQLNESGFDALGPLHAATLPWPDLATFLGQCAEYVDTLPPVTESFKDKRCVELDQAGIADIENEPAFQRAEASAQTYYRLYRLAKRALQFVPPPARPATEATIEATFCVKKPPSAPDEWKVCVPQITSDMDTLTIDGAAAAALSLDGSPTAPLESGVILDHPVATLDSTLQGVAFKWDEGPLTCIFGPTVELTVQEIEDSPTLTDWTTCEDQIRSAVYAEPSSALGYDVVLEVPSDNNTDVESRNAEDFLLLIPSSTPTGTCNMDFLRPDVLNHLATWSSEVADTLTFAWSEGDALSSQAEAIENLLDPFDVAETAVCGDVGLVAIPTADAEPNRAITWTYEFGAYASGTFPYSVAWPYTLYNPPTEDAELGGLDPLGQPYDQAWSVSTNVLNHILRAGVEAGALHAPLELTWNELGLSPPVGTDPDAVAHLTGNLLGTAIDPAFLSYGATEITLELEPHLPPITWMPLDGAEPAGQYPVTWQLGELHLTFVAHGGGGPTPILDLAIDVYDPDYQITLPLETGDPFLTAYFGAPNVFWTITATDLTACPMSYQLAYALVAPSCGSSLVTAIADVVQPVLEERLESLLDQVPAPTFFDANQGWDEGSDQFDLLRRTELTTPWFDGQRMTWYAHLVEPSLLDAWYTDPICAL